MTAGQLLMNAILKPGADGRECTSGTLGDLIYSDKAKPYVSEKEWLAILQSIAAGDRLALRALYERTHRIVFTLAMRVLDNRESAEEVTLDVFQAVWRLAAIYDPTVGSVIGWISGLARSKAVDRLRFKQESGNAVLPGASPLAALALEERQVIESALFSDSTYVEVAAQLRQPPGTVRSRIRHGLAKLRVALAKEDTAS